MVLPQANSVGSKGKRHKGKSRHPKWYCSGLRGRHYPLESNCTEYILSSPTQTAHPPLLSLGDRYSWTRQDGKKLLFLYMWLYHHHCWGFYILQ